MVGSVDATYQTLTFPGRARRRCLATAARQRTVLLLLRERCCSVADACRATGIPRSTFYMWVKRDEQFARALNNYHDVMFDLRMRNGAHRWVSIEYSNTSEDVNSHVASPMGVTHCEEELRETADTDQVNAHKKRGGKELEIRHPHGEAEQAAKIDALPSGADAVIDEPADGGGGSGDTGNW